MYMEVIMMAGNEEDKDKKNARSSEGDNSLPRIEIQNVGVLEQRVLLDRSSVAKVREKSAWSTGNASTSLRDNFTPDASQDNTGLLVPLAQVRSTQSFGDLAYSVTRNIGHRSSDGAMNSRSAENYESYEQLHVPQNSPIGDSMASSRTSPYVELDVHSNTPRTKAGVKR